MLPALAFCVQPSARGMFLKKKRISLACLLSPAMSRLMSQLLSQLAAAPNHPRWPPALASLISFRPGPTRRAGRSWQVGTPQVLGFREPSLV